MLGIYETALAPLLLAQAFHVRRSVPRLEEPAGPREGIEGVGHRKRIRLLVVGESSAAGVGVEHQSQAFAQQLARSLAIRLSMGVQWCLIAKSGATTMETRALLRSKRICRADLVVSALGVNDITARHEPANFIHEYRLLIEELFHRTRAAFAVVSGLPPLHLLPAAPQPLRWYLGQCAHFFDRLLRQWCSSAPNLEYASFQLGSPEYLAADKFHPGPVHYMQWARMVASQVGERLLTGSRMGGRLPFSNLRT